MPTSLLTKWEKEYAQIQKTLADFYIYSHKALSIKERKRVDLEIAKNLQKLKEVKKFITR